MAKHWDESGNGQTIGRVGQWRARQLCLTRLHRLFSSDMLRVRYSLAFETGQAMDNVVSEMLATNG